MPIVHVPAGVSSHCNIVHLRRFREFYGPRRVIYVIRRLADIRAIIDEIVACERILKVILPSPLLPARINHIKETQRVVALLFRQLEQPLIHVVFLVTCHLLSY